jgi:Raf kinase inhibitor-like YbhB/YbcL family protein
MPGLRDGYWRVIQLLTLLGVCWAAPAAPASAPGLTLTSSAFADGGTIPDAYTEVAGAAAKSPPLAWTHVPPGTASFAVLVHDPDVALDHSAREFVHWIIFNIPAEARGLSEHVPNSAHGRDGSVQLKNSSGAVGYMGMGAPAPGPAHHYTFEVFALDTKLDLGPDATQADVLKAMDHHVLDKGVLVGRFHLP